jgi:flagellar motor switch protein FliN/FliY
MGDAAQTRVVDSIPLPRELWPEVLELPCQLTVALEVPHFAIRDLLSLSVNSLVSTQRREGAHVPVIVNGVMVGWAEFDVIDGRLAVRTMEMI